MKLESSRQIFEKYSGIKYHESPSLGSELFHSDWRTTDVTKPFEILQTRLKTHKD